MSAGRRAAVVGGSIGGLTAALLLRDAGWEVDVHERSARPLEGRGAGIVLHPATGRYLVERAGVQAAGLGVDASRFRCLDPAGRVVHEEPCCYRFTSYETLYRGLLGRLDGTRYHLGEECTGLAEAAGRPRLTFASGRSVAADLVVFADGAGSTGRRLLAAGGEPSFAGYVAWRGTVRADEAGPGPFAALSEALTYCLLPDGHALAYPIPAPAAEPGRRLLNWLWYRNVAGEAELAGLLTGAGGVRYERSVPPGLVAPARVAELVRAAYALLPPVLAGVVACTADPFLQVVADGAVERLAVGRACLVGDAAATVRPHVAAGTAKAAEDAWTLVAALEGAGDDLEPALAAWSERQAALAASVLARAREAGERLQGGRWRAAEPLPFGLHDAGDSSFAPARGRAALRTRRT